MDFGLLPPEINSGRMYSGAGATSMLAASASWDAIAVQLAASAADLAATISGLAWRGPSAAAMTAAAARYRAWLTRTSAHAETTAGQIRTAAAAFEQAFGSTVPPAEIASNRAELAALISSNFLGQNTAAIMATEAAYAEMWAQDTAAMIEYQAASAQCSNLPPITPPQPVTVDASQLPGELDTWAQSITSSGAPFEVPMTVLQLFSSMWAVSPIASSLSALATSEATAATRSVAAPVATAAVRAQFAVGRPVGLLRTPPSWAQSPTASTAALAAPLAIAEPVAAPLTTPMPLGPPRGGTPTKRERPQPEYGAPVRFTTRPPAGG